MRASDTWAYVRVRVCLGLPWRRAHRGGWDSLAEGTSTIFLALACIAAVVAVLLIRPARSGPVPARVCPGDAVATDEGINGIVERLDGTFALVRTTLGQRFWADAARLMRGPPTTDTTGTVDAAGHDAVTGLGLGPHHPSPADLPATHGALSRLAAGVYEARRTIVFGWILIILCCLPLSATAEKSFSAGGFLPPGDAMDVQADMQQDFNLPITTETVMVPGPLDTAQARLTKATSDLYQVDHMLAVSPPRASKDGKLVAFDVGFDAPDDISQNSFLPVNDALVAAGFARSSIEVAGTPAFWHDTSTLTKEDLAKAEAIGIPGAALVLLLVFGTLTAALLPLLVGTASVIVTLALLHILSLPLDLSIFVMNIASMLGFGLGIDYSLLGVSRFREELDAGRSVRDATMITVTSAGRAAAISGVAVLLGLSALAVIPLGVMMSLAVGGVVVVSVTVLASLTLLPAALGMLGHRIERFPVRRKRPEGASAGTGRWYALAHFVMRHPALAIALALVILLALASPARNIELGVPHTEVLPRNAPSSVAERKLKSRFGTVVESPHVVLLESDTKADVDATLAKVRAVSNVESARVVARDASSHRSVILVSAREGRQGGPKARALARRLQKLDLPAPARIGGQGQGEIEFLNTIKQGVPKTIALVYLSTFLILAIAFRSLTLPIKAILLDTLSILASLGMVSAVFQFGNGAAGLLDVTALGYTEATIPIILFCVLFGLSMDYEVFMLAKVSERYQAGDDNREATAQGVATTAPLVTGAALILIVVGAAFALTELVLVKQIGFGMAVALALDATLVRVLLLPATMRYLGDANWWMPDALLKRVPRLNWAH